MFALDPINSITSIVFYKKIAKQPVSRSFLYLAYLSLIFSLAATLAMKVRLGPAIDETFRWLETSAPVLTFADGKFFSTARMPVTLRHPEFADIAVTIDTTRTIPVTPQEMDAGKVMAYLISTDLYVRRENGSIEDYSFSKSPVTKPVTLDAAFYRNANLVLDRLLYPVALLILIVSFFIWKTISSLFYSLLAMALNSRFKSNLRYAHLFNMAVYAQTLVFAIQLIFLFVPARIPIFSMLAFLITGAYLWLAMSRNLGPTSPVIA